MNKKYILIDQEFLKSKSEVHLLPCKIYFNGVTDVKSFFSSSIIKTQAVKIENDENQKTESIKIFFLVG